jgi:S-adenosylmethionine/arginine decarboxylase-like enzyme
MEIYQVEALLNRVVDEVNMNTLMGPYVIRCNTVGNEGITGAVVIETSHCSIHLWDTGRVSFDLYSCMDFDEQVVISMVTDLKSLMWSVPPGLVNLKQEVTDLVVRVIDRNM